MYIIYHIPRTRLDTFRIIEIKYIYLTPIPYTYTSRPYVYYVVNPITPIPHTYTSRPHVYYVVNPITITISLKCIRLLRRYTLACCALLPSSLRSPSIETRRRERNKAKAKKK